ncbi:putative nitroalkane oxidase [Arabidopsis thaliana]
MKGILGFEYGIVQAPLGPDISGPELVAAVANAGGIGLLRCPDWECPDYLRELIRKTKTLTEKPFGIGVVLAFPHDLNIKTILEEKVAVLQLYWGDCSQELVDDAHFAGVKVIPQVGNVEEARKAVAVGVDAIIVQGHEAGGHVIGKDGLFSLLPRVVDLVGERDIPVIAAGGIVDGRGYVAALSLGAQGVCLGTRWPGAPQRVLETPFFDDWRSLPAHENEVNQPIIGRSTIHGVEKEIRRFSGTVPNMTTTGDLESMAMYAGQSVGLIKEILPAGEVVKSLVEEAQALILQKFNNATTT